MYSEDNCQLDIDQNADLRDVSSTARLFNFRRPVFMTTQVWEDCVELIPANGNFVDELAVLQRLRHVLFMAASVLHGRTEDVDFDFRIYRVSSEAKDGKRQPEPVDLHLVADKNENNQPVITIKFSDQ